MDFPFKRSRKGKSGVDVRHAIQLIASQYSFEPQKAALIELVANGLDARATRIEVRWDEQQGVLEVTDNGCGMERQQLEKYHDLATSRKTWQEGIGFAGQGAKIALNFCHRVITETYSKSYRGWSEWWLEGSEAPWKIQDGKTKGLRHQGTRVALLLNPTAKGYDEASIKETLVEHYAPLLDKSLVRIYTGEVPPAFLKKKAVQLSQPIYSKGLRFLVNDEPVMLPFSVEELENFKVVSLLLRRKFRVIGYFGLAKDGARPVEPGVSVCTYGKVVERTWFKKEPQQKERIVGWIEAPFLIRAVTTDKCRFQKGNQLWDGFFRKAQAEFTRWLQESGLLATSSGKKAKFTSLEKEINSILTSFPEFSFYGGKVEREVAMPDRVGEQRQLGLGVQDVGGTAGGEGEGNGVGVWPGEEEKEAPTLMPGSGPPATTRLRLGKGGVSITFEDQPTLEKEAWFDGANVCINRAHSAYTKAERKGLVEYHIMKSAVLSLLEFTMEKEATPDYHKAFDTMQRFFKVWGER